MEHRREAKTFTRNELYELVWSKPRTALSKDIGISDVAITKYCRAARIPTPAMGYWAKLAAGKKAIRLPLPARLPGQTDTFTVGGDPHSWRWPSSGAESLSEQPMPPVFAEDLDQQVAAVVKRIGRVVATRDLTKPVRSLAKILDAEAKRRLQSESDTWNSRKPHFDEPVFQRHLRLFNSIARALEPVYGLQGVGEQDEWVQGRGTLHHLTLHLGFGGSGMYLRVHEPGEPRRDRKPKPVTATTLRVETGGFEEPVLEWSDQKGRKLENQLADIVSAIVRRAEERLRWHEQWYYERQCERRNEELAEIEKRRGEAERERLEAIAAHKANVRSEVIALAERRRTAEDIRATVASLRQHPEVQTADGQLKFDAWAAHALTVADDLDPMNCSLQQLLGTFEHAA